MTPDQARRDRQKAFAAEQAKTARELDELHRLLHPEKYTGQNGRKTR